jgi:hypothetical protein
MDRSGTIGRVGGAATYTRSLEESRVLV